jgi:hypothetical protein
VADFGISGVEPWGSATRELVLILQPRSTGTLIQDLEITAMKERRASTNGDRKKRGTKSKMENEDGERKM